jgi:hypothetical protein
MVLQNANKKQSGNWAQKNQQPATIIAEPAICVCVSPSTFLVG